MAANSKLFPPLFCDGAFNREGRRMRAVHEMTVSNGTDSYRLWRSAGKPNNKYANAENDKYYLYVEINGYLAPVGLTEYTLIGRCGTKAVDERYGGREARRLYLPSWRKITAKRARRSYRPWNYSGCDRDVRGCQ